MATMLPEGQVTATIYGLIKEEKYNDAILILAEFRQSFSKVHTLATTTPKQQNVKAVL